MIVFPNAKINLGLNIVSKREDGYHNLETIFYPVPVYDILEVIPNKKDDKDFSLEVIGMSDDGKPNLVEKAYRALADRYDIGKVSVVLKKNIPFAAGLGGGSSDAAFMLKVLSEMFIKDISDSELHKIAASIGADCPFFLDNKPVLAKGIGTDLSKIELSLNGYYIVLIKPDIAISTAEAYSGVAPCPPDYNISDAIDKPVSEWRNFLKNDFETSLFEKYPRLKSIKDFLYGIGADYASMSGSGSTIFGLFKNIPDNNIINSFILNSDRVFIERL